MSHETQRRGGALAPWLLGLGLTGALWGAVGGSCAGTRSAPLSSLTTPPPPPETIEQTSGTLVAGDSAEETLPEIDPQVASRFNLLQEAMNTSAVQLPDQANGSDGTPEPFIDWSAPAEPVETIATLPESAIEQYIKQWQTAPPPPVTDEVAQVLVSPQVVIDPAERTEALADELAALTTSQAVTDGSVVQGLLQAAALEMILPGVSDAAFNDDHLAHAIAPDELSMLRTWRDVLRSMGASGSDAGALVEAADDLAAATARLRDLTIANPALCTRVDGFGVYNTLPTRDGRYTLVAGQNNRVIVYVELEHFATTAMRRDGLDGFTVELIQSLALFHAGTPRIETDRDLVAWRRPEARIDDFSRRARRDFFVVQMIELPSTLSVGSYRLKVMVADRASGAEAEATIDIDVVADRALTLGQHP